MNIKEKLARLEAASGEKKQPVPPPEPDDSVESWITQIRQELNLSVLRESKSFILLKENYYPVYREEAFLRLRENGFEAPYLQRITADIPAESSNLKHAVFIDTETTGLAGGTGTYAFLVGIGHLELDHIVVRQYLLPDFGHEWLMLKHLENVLQNFRFTVSFNGKSFDIPLLKNRYVLNRSMSILEELPHVDILHAARRIWRLRLPACDLQSLEKHILNIGRVGDIPGEIIPQIYFEFIRKRDALHLRDVLEHNYHDIVNMILLTVRIAGICESPSTHLTHDQDRLSLAKYFYQTRLYREAITLLETIVTGEHVPGPDLLTESLFLLSMAHKKCGEPDTAGLHLRKLMDRQVLHPTVIEELAKIYEHETKDYVSAREVVEKGLSYLETIRQLDTRSDLLRYIPHLKHRRQRILRKIESAEKDAPAITNAEES